MIKCDRCGYTNEKVSIPMICPKCGSIAKPYIIKERKKKENTIVQEEVVLEKLED